MALADIIGIGRTKAGELWHLGLIDVAVEAGLQAMTEAACRPTALIMANALGNALGHQRNLAAYVGAKLGLSNIETAAIEADEASGGAAIRLAISLLNATMHERILVIGAEKTTDALSDDLEAVRAGGLDVFQEAGFGFTLSSAAALAMQRYIATYRIQREDFYHFSAIAHAHAAQNEMAYFGWPLSREHYEKSPVVADPVTVCDAAPPCDGAAALMICRVQPSPEQSVGIIGSSSISHAPGIAGPAVDLELPAAKASAAAALEQAGLGVDDISLFEVHDSNTVIAALSLEAVGLAAPGHAAELAAGKTLHLNGPKPTWTFGGHKARGHTLGAAGVYQVAEAALQLLGKAGKNQVSGATTALTQCLGSFGTTAVTHVLSRR
ncbi:MAG: thiolase domain-containing protein [Myxococcota bacterium]|nr:thiolase domain-containing protein [Myxococcota bacterium]